MTEATSIHFDNTEPRNMDTRPRVSFGRGMVLPNSSVPLPSYVGSPGYGRGVPTNTDEGGVSLLVGQDAQAPYTSTPIRPQSSETDATLKHLGVLIAELGKHIGDSVTARLLSDKESQSGDGRGAQTCGTTVDLAQLTMALKSDAKEPPIFRGEATDRCSVHEWVDLMSMYLKKKNVDLADQSDEIMGKLMGRARDVARIGIRSNPSLSVELHPDAIYAILKQHFSDLSYSCMPLADFYSTLPRAHESPIDYWVRLNKAADITEECLQRQGKSMGDLNKEVAMMFVRHCNEPSLSVVFRSKLADSWTAKEVQERIDEYHREIKSRHNKPAAERPSRQAVAVVSSAAQEVGRPEHEGLLHSHKQSVGQPQQSSEFAAIQNSMDKMAEMLGEVLTSLSASSRPPASRGQDRSFQKRKVSGPRGCSICNDSSHSTIAHCQLHRLCFLCHQPGHMKLQCPNTSSPAPQSAAASPLHQGN